MTLLDALETAGLTRSTLIIRIADHGEMGLSHGLVQKTFNAYEETIHIPMVVSNPRLFPRPVRTRELVGLLDVAPTVAALAGVLPAYRGHFQGADFSGLFTARDRPVHDAIHFTFDDTAACPPPPDIPGHIRALRTRDRLYAAYFNPAGTAFDYELYDLGTDPGQTRNLASPRHATRATRTEMAKLDRRLTQAMATFSTAPDGFAWPDAPKLDAARSSGG